MDRNEFNPYQAPVSEVTDKTVEVNAIDLSRFEGMDEEAIKKLNKHSSDINYIGVGSALAALVSVMFIYEAFDQTAQNFVVPVLSLLFFSVSSYGCFARPKWGKLFGNLSSIIFLFAFPIGTYFGVVGIRAILDNPQLFGEDRITDREVSEAVARIERQSA